MSDLLQDPVPGLGSLSCIQAWPANSDGVPEPPKDPADGRFCCADTQYFIYGLSGFLVVNPMEGFSVKPGLQPLLCEMRSSIRKAAQELPPCGPVSGKLALQNPIVVTFHFASWGAWYYRYSLFTYIQIYISTKSLFFFFKKNVCLWKDN